MTGTGNMLKRTVAHIAVALCLCACLLALAGCGSQDKQALLGEWQVQGTEVTVVFTQDEFKMVGNTFGYTMDTGSKTISYTSGDIDYGSATYSFNEDNTQLTLTQTSSDGTEETTIFDKVSDDTSAEPSASATADDGTGEEATEIDDGSESEDE